MCPCDISYSATKSSGIDIREKETSATSFKPSTTTPTHYDFFSEYNVNDCTAVRQIPSYLLSKVQSQCNSFLGESTSMVTSKFRLDVSIVC